MSSSALLRQRLQMRNLVESGGTIPVTADVRAAGDHATQRRLEAVEQQITELASIMGDHKRYFTSVCTGLHAEMQQFQEHLLKELDNVRDQFEATLQEQEHRVQSFALRVAGELGMLQTKMDEGFAQWNVQTLVDAVEGRLLPAVVDAMHRVSDDDDDEDDEETSKTSGEGSSFDPGVKDEDDEIDVEPKEELLLVPIVEMSSSPAAAAAAEAPPPAAPTSEIKPDSVPDTGDARDARDARDAANVTPESSVEPAAALLEKAETAGAGPESGNERESTEETATKAKLEEKKGEE